MSFQRLQRDDLRAGVEELLVVSDVIGMMLRVDDEPYRQAGNRSDLFHHAVVVLIAGILGVDDDQALGRDANQRVRTATGNHVEVRLELTDLLYRLPGPAPAPSSPALRRLRHADRGGQREQNDESNVTRPAACHRSLQGREYTPGDRRDRLESDGSRDKQAE